jgi:hypothetical protein
LYPPDKLFDLLWSPVIEPEHAISGLGPVAFLGTAYSKRGQVLQDLAFEKLAQLFRLVGMFLVLLDW